jgi:hypothetical protein
LLAIFVLRSSYRRFIPAQHFHKSLPEASAALQAVQHAEQTGCGVPMLDSTFSIADWGSLKL